MIKVQGVKHHKSEEAYPKTHYHARRDRHVEFDLTVTIDRQDGFRFSGTKQSAKHKETASGMIGFDNKTLYMVDDDGIAFRRLVVTGQEADFSY